MEVYKPGRLASRLSHNNAKRERSSEWPPDPPACDFSVASSRPQPEHALQQQQQGRSIQEFVSFKGSSSAIDLAAQCQARYNWSPYQDLHCEPSSPVHRLSAEVRATRRPDSASGPDEQGCCTRREVQSNAQSRSRWLGCQRVWKGFLAS